MGDNQPKTGKLIDLDNALMKRIAKGDDEAFQQLFERNKRLAWSVVYRQIGNVAGAEDLVQDAFLRVYRAAPKYEPSAKFSTWFYTVVTNLCLNFKRDRARDKLRLLSGSESEEDGNLLEQLAVAPEIPAGADEDEQRKAAVAEAIQSLPENQRMALILSRYEEKSYEEVAEILGVTAAAVKSLTSRARTTLKEKLQRWFEKLED